MKICFFDDEPEIFPLQYGGKARTIVNLASEFIKKEEVEEVTILSRSIFSKQNEFFKDGIKFVSLDDSNTMELIKEYIDKYDIMNIHCCSYTFPNIIGKAKKFYFLHDVLIATADKGSHLDKSLGGNFDAVIAPSKFAQKIYKKYQKILNINTNCYVIPRHINNSLFECISEDAVKTDIKCPSLIKKLVNNIDIFYFFLVGQ